MPHTPTNDKSQPLNRRKQSPARFSPDVPSPSSSQSTLPACAVETDLSSSSSASLAGNPARSRRNAFDAGESRRPNPQQLMVSQQAGPTIPKRTSSAMPALFADTARDVGSALPADDFDAGDDYNPPAWKALRERHPHSQAGSEDEDVSREQQQQQQQQLQVIVAADDDGYCCSGGEYGPPLTPPTEEELFERHLSDRALRLGPAGSPDHTLGLIAGERSTKTPLRRLSFDGSGAPDRLSVPPEHVRRALISGESSSSGGGGAQTRPSPPARRKTAWSKVKSAVMPRPCGASSADADDDAPRPAKK